MEQAVSASSGSVDLKECSDIPICVLVTSRTTTLLKHGIATLLVRNTQFDAADLFNNLVRFYPDGLPEAVLKEINIIATVLLKLHHPNILNIHGIHFDISWDHENKVLQNMPSLSKFQLEHIEDNLIQEISSGIRLLEDDIIKSSPTVETLTLVEEAMKKLQSSTSAEQREAIEGLAAGLVAGVIDKSPLSLTRLIDMFQGEFPETVSECLQYIDSSHSQILDNGGKLEGDLEIQELLAQYKRCVNFFVGDLRCLPFKSSDMVTRDLVEMRPTAEEMTLIITGYDEEQYFIWRQANHHLAGLLDGKESGALDETTGDTKELQEKNTDLTAQEVNTSAQTSSQTTPIPKHLGGLQTVPSDIPLCVLIVNRIRTLLVKALALHLVRKSEYNMADLIDRLSSVLSAGYGKTSIKELNIIAKIISKIQPKAAVEGQTTPGTIEWDNKYNRLKNVPTGLRVQLASLPLGPLKVRCLNISLLEGVIIQTLPTVETLTLVEEAIKKLQSPTPAEQIEAIEGLVAGLVAGVLDKSPLSLMPLIDMFHGEFPPSAITSSSLSTTARSRQWKVAGKLKLWN
ncbi:hypothetical protein EB796_004028 [Bugula neritina]|uniref:Uncharacterized protein n=1 Tax=Bugula neritina TaxID=10212 RepID=A0A7J7KK06_BUGNE|nr:hypothetical protein EB796_004028 [Bugula neritina]